MRRRLAGALLAVAALGLAGCAEAGSGSTAAPTAPGSTAPASAPPSVDPAARGATGALQDPLLDTVAALTPVSVSVPVLGVDSPLERLGRGADGWIEPPIAVDRAGWYEDGVVPGSVGPAVIAGHVDSRIGPGVFVDLAALEPGAEVVVTLSDGSTRTFAVTRSIQVPKEAFPTEEVYGAVPTPELRLVTCGGDFDPGYGHYVDNVVVFAELVR